MSVRHGVDQPDATLGAPPHRVMLVLVAVSSMNTNLAKFSEGRSSYHVLRAWATSGRLCSVACIVFFARQLERLQRLPDQRGVGGNLQQPQLCKRRILASAHPVT